ncbi:MAG: hypothetical protein WB698_14045, partial [Solirubrobacteraceae bacterium]
MLTKGTYIVPVLIAAVAFPAAALASTGSSPAPRIGLAGAQPVKVDALQRPVEQFEREVRIEARRLRAERRARMRRQH